jgi:uncharacterized protein (DUF1684 family)
VILAAAFCVLLAPPPVPSSAAYVAEIEKWRSDRETRLRSDYGWLSVAGLFWLEPGTHTFGRDPASEFVLPTHAPLRAGVIERRGDVVTVTPEPGVPMTIDGKLVLSATPLVADGPPLRMGAVQLQLIKREDRLGLRLRDPASALRRDFKGLRWFPIDESYRIQARWVPYDKPHTLPITNVLGQTTEEQSPGYAEFKRDGKTLKLVPIYEDGDTSQLFFIIKDKTAPSLTYGAGRFLYADPPKDGVVVLDFNKAYNPPCAFNPYTTCPIAPKDNQLPIEIRAGELKYGSH